MACSKCGGNDYSKSGHCKPCKKEYDKKWKENNADRYKKLLVDWRANNSDTIKNYLNETKEKRALWQKQYDEEKRNRQIQPHWKKADKEYMRKAVSEWKKLNRHKVLDQVSRRRAILCKAVPLWANRELIQDIYAKSYEKTQMTGIQHHVDHIIPLKGKTVCGLHVEYNLQILTAAENLAKSAKLIEIE